VFAGNRAFRVDEAESVEKSPIFGPKLDERDFFEIDFGLALFEYRASVNLSRAKLQGGKSEVPVIPKFFWRRWNEVFSGVYGPPNELLGLWSECKINSFIRAEEIGNDRKCGAFNISKEESFSLLIDDPSVNFGKLKIRIDLCFYLDNIVFDFEGIKKRAQVTMHRKEFAREKRKRHDELI